MGIFGKTVAKRKWTDVRADLHCKLRDLRSTWFSEFVQHASSTDIGLISNELSPEIGSAIASLQWAVAVTTVREGGYIRPSDLTFFFELLYIAVTERGVEEMMYDDAMKLLEVDDPKKAMQLWGNIMVPLVSDSTNNPKLAELLSQRSAAIITQTMILTCEACFDRKGADALRRTLE